MTPPVAPSIQQSTTHLFPFQLSWKPKLCRWTQQLVSKLVSATGVFWAEGAAGLNPTTLRSGASQPRGCHGDGLLKSQPTSSVSPNGNLLWKHQREESDFAFDVQRRPHRRADAGVCDLLLAAAGNRCCPLF